MSTLQISPRLKKAIQLSAANGNDIAQFVLSAMRDRDPIRGDTNFFDLEEYYDRSDSFVNISNTRITACRKSLDFPTLKKQYHEDPSLPWRADWRSDINPSAFLSAFRTLMNCEFSGGQLSEFMHSLALRSKVTIAFMPGSFIQRAYDEKNYDRFFKTNTLHRSCMRYRKSSWAAYNFYNKLCNNRILVAQNDVGEIMGRAIIWDDVTFFSSRYVSDFRRCPTETSAFEIQQEVDGGVIIPHLTVMDRVYASNDYVQKMMRDYALQHGVDLWKGENTCQPISCFRAVSYKVRDYLHENVDEDCEDLFNGVLFKRLADGRGYVGGVPYVDTFKYVTKFDDDDHLWLSTSNCHRVTVLGSLSVTDMHAAGVENRCALCGIDSCDDLLCENCRNTIAEQTVFGPRYNGGWVTRYGEKVPKVVADSRYLLSAIIAQKMRKGFEL